MKNSRLPLLVPILLLLNCPALLGQFIYTSSGEALFEYYDEETNSETAIFSDAGFIKGMYIDIDSQHIVTLSNDLHFITYDMEGKQLAKDQNFSLVPPNNFIFYFDQEGNLISNASTGITSIKADDPFVDEIVIATGNVVDFVVNNSQTITYWADGSTNKIHKANLDGTEVEELYYLPSGLADIRSIRLDTEEGKVYWTNYGQGRIQRISIDGTAFENLLVGLDQPRALEIVDDYIYWSSNKTILRYHIPTTATDTIAKDLPNEPERLKYSSTTDELYWMSYDGAVIQKVRIQTLQKTPVIAGTGLLLASEGIAYDPLSQKIYTHIDLTNELLRCDLDGSNSEKLELSVGFISSKLALDPVDELVFLLNFDGLNFYDLKSGSSGSLLDLTLGPIWDPAEAMQLDVTNRKIYFAAGDTIYQIDYDGNNLQSFYTNEGAQIRSFAVDLMAELLYYSDGEFIRRANLTNSVDEPIILGSASDIMIDVANGALYYVKSRALYKSDLDGYFEEKLTSGSNIEMILSEDISSFIVLNTVNGIALPSGNNIELSWGIDETFIASTNGDDTGDFLIQKRDSDNQWTEIGSVPYISNTSTYMFIDQDPETGLNQYRLQYQSEDEGLVAFSTTFDVDFISTAVENVAAATSLIYSMQTGDLIATNAIGSLRIMDMSGRLVLNRKIVSEQIQIPLSHYGPGVYVVSLKSKDGSLFTKKITVI